MQITANGLHLEVEDTGPPGAPVVLLIMGLGMQLIAWPPEWVQALQQAGFRVIRHDNRDVGLSQHLDALGAPNLLWESVKLRLGLRPRAPYTLHDMAADALGVLDALGVQQAHVVGVSMGGMIAQRLALLAPQRVRSLTSIMSSSGAPRLPQPEPAVLKVLLSRPAGNSPDALVAHYLRLFGAIGSPGFVVPEAELRQRILAGVARSFRPLGTLRQMMAVVADTGRWAELGAITAPTLVLHGKADPLVPYACGQDTAQRIPGARLVGFDGMGHDLPPGVVALLLPHLLGHLQACTPPGTSFATPCG